MMMVSSQNSKMEDMEEEKSQENNEINRKEDENLNDELNGEQMNDVDSGQFRCYMTSIIHSFVGAQQQNNIKSYIKQLQKYKYLNKLDISESGNPISNSIMQKIGFSLSFLKNLEYLSLKNDNQKLDYFSTINLYDYLKQLKHLKVLLFQINFSQDQIQYNLFQFIQYLPNLQVLYLNSLNNICQSGGVSLGNSISKLNFLQSLKIQFFLNCDIGKEGDISIGKSLSEQKYLYWLILNFSQCPISEQQATSIGQGISKLNQLRQLEFKISNLIKLQSETGIILMQSFKPLQNLKELRFDIQDEQKGQFFNFLCDSLEGMKHLIRLNFFFSIQKDQINNLRRLSRFFDKGCDEQTFILQFFFNKAEMKQNDKQITFIYDKNIPYIPYFDILSQFDETIPIKINFYNSCNNIINDDKISKSIRQLKTKNLTIVFNYGINIGKDIVYFIEPLISCTQLHYLNIEINNKNLITKDVLKEFSQQLIKLKQLKRLTFNLRQQNNIEVSDCIAIIKSLYHLDKLFQLRFFYQNNEYQTILNRHIFKLPRLVTFDNF